jgi:FkbM family methyltransferase
MAGRFISYSINGEDIILHRIFGQQEQGFYVDIGAGHPTMDNDMRSLYDRGWAGINVEPNGTYHAALVAERPRDLILQVAVAEEEGVLPYWEIEGTGLSTCDAEEAARARQKGHALIEHQVQTTTLARLLTDAGVSSIDILKVDVEGLEFRVLQGNDWTCFRPRLVLVEATLPETPDRRPDRIRPFLEQNGYDFAYFDGLNDFFVERSFVPPPDSFRPISVFDQADRYELVTLREHAANLEHAKALQDTYAHQLEAECAKQSDQARLLQLRLTEAEQLREAAQQSLVQLSEMAPAELDRLRNDLDRTKEDLEAARVQIAAQELANAALRTGLYRAKQAARALEERAKRDRAQASLALQQLDQAGERLMSLQRSRLEALPDASGLDARFSGRHSSHDVSSSLRRERDEALRLLAATRASSSWMVTRPLRGAARLFRHFARMARGSAERRAFQPSENK